MSVTFTRSDDVLCALLSGEIDHHTAADMRMLIDSEMERTLPKTLILDFSEVQFMDSSGIGLILGRKKYIEAMNGAVFIKNTPSYVRKIISLAGLERLILSDKPKGKCE
ncbi:MAG: STAS domain-containing protein [Ruminococcaceae bacterium]|nr:STAS domain-containing protein [Oscillospiraceae bacterium]